MFPAKPGKPDPAVPPAKARSRKRPASRKIPPRSRDLPPYTPTLRFAASPRSAASARAEALVVYAFEGAKKVEGIPEGTLRRTVEALVESEGFRARAGRVLLFHTAGRFPARRVIVAGLGRGEAFTLDALRAAAAAAARRAAGANVKRLIFGPPPSSRGVKLAVGERARAVAEGFLLGAYRMRRYFTGEERTEGASLRGAEILVARSDLAAARSAVKGAVTACSAANLARDLVNEPAGTLTPRRMAEIASALARSSGIECRVHDERAIEKLGMGAFLGVGRGSHQPPRLIHLIYRPERPAARKVALIGKGLTFDSGGLSLKSASGMETMKLDKAGASCVLATMLGLAEVRPRVEVHGLMGMTENMPGGSAIKPGDILKTSGGKTVEVLNTDAEGRLVLADLLCYARTLGVDEIIDLATLTGACMVALGPLAAGVFGNDRAHVDGILSAAEKAGEKMWPLPLYEEYRVQLRSEIADIRNTADKYGGAITAALFLREFVDRRTPWAHIDIAGPAFLESNGHPYMRKGATGVGVRTLLTYLSSLS